MKKRIFPKDMFTISTASLDSKQPCIIVSGLYPYDRLNIKKKRALLEALMAQ